MERREARGTGETAPLRDAQTNGVSDQIEGMWKDFYKIIIVTDHQLIDSRSWQRSAIIDWKSKNDQGRERQGQEESWRR